MKTIQEEKQSLIDELGRPFTALEHVIFELYGKDVDCKVWVESGILYYKIFDKLDFVK